MTIEWYFMVWLKRGTSCIYQVVERPTSPGTLLRVFGIIAPYQIEKWHIVKIDFIWNSIILEHSKGQLFSTANMDWPTDKIKNDGFIRIFQLNFKENAFKYTQNSVNDEFMQTQDSITDKIGHINSVLFVVHDLDPR